MNFVQRKATTSKSKYTVVNFSQVKKAFLANVTIVVIPPELILIWDPIGIKFVPCSSWWMERKGTKWVEMVSISDTCQIAAVFCGSLVREFYPCS